MIAIVCLVLACLACAVLSRHGFVERRRLRRALHQAEAAREAAQRTARLASLDLREAALRVHGHAAAPDSAASLATLVQRCRSLADDLGLAGRSADPPGLHEEPIDLLECAREAAEAVAVTIAPGRREFRIPSAGEARVWADRRAVRQVLGRVLTEAALNTGEGDWVVLGLEESAESLVLEVSDEGRGLASTGAAPSVRRDCRGVGTGLALARTLMEAHGGRLEVVAAPGTGTRVSLCFPANRRRGTSEQKATSAIRATQPS